MIFCKLWASITLSPLAKIEKHMVQARIIAQGSYLPARVMTNHDLEKIVDTSHEWIVTRTGMKERRIANGDEYASHMGAKAAAIALERASVCPEDVDLILVATMTPDYLTPSTAALIQQELGCTRAGAVDLSAACTGYLYALATAKAYIESSMVQHVLVIATEKLSSFVNWQDRSTCVLFGDGAGACIVSSKGRGMKIGQVVLGADGEQQELFKIPGGGSRQPASVQSLNEGAHFLTMEGRELFRHAVRRLCQSADECLHKNHLRHEDIDWIVCHQANARILEAVAQKLELDPTRVYKNLEKYGNTSASSVAIALDELCQDASLEPFNNVLLLAFGAGLTWGGAVLSIVDA